MKKLTLFAMLIVSGGIGMGAIPTYYHLYPTVGEPPEPPTLVSAEEIVATVRSDAFLVSSRTDATAIVTVRPKLDMSSDVPTSGLWDLVGSWWKTETTKDRLTVKVKGVVLAGFDLRHIDQSNVISATDHQIVFSLGTPQFLGVLDDEMATETISRETGWLRFNDDTLYLASQSLGKRVLQTAACKKGALTTAGTSGAHIVERITTLLRARGDRRAIQIIFVPRHC